MWIFIRYIYIYMSSLNSSPQQPRFFEAPLSCFSEASTRLLPRETKWHTLKRVSQDHLEWPDFLPLAGFFRTILHGLIVASCRPHLSISLQEEQWKPPPQDSLLPLPATLAKPQDVQTPKERNWGHCTGVKMTGSVECCSH